MNKNQPDTDNFKALQILDELSRNDSLTQRDLSKQLGIALGLVNSYIKNLIRKGHITIKSIPPKRYAYYLTPKGFAEKTRLTYNLLQDYTRVYREARVNVGSLFNDLQRKGARRVVFAGVDEVAEIAYITLKETSMELVAAVDDDAAARRFFEHDVKHYDALRGMKYDFVLVTSYLKRQKILDDLRRNGVKDKKIKEIFK